MIPHARVRAALRQIWWKYDEGRKEAIAAARVYRGVYLCQGCRTSVTAKELEVDHVDAVGPTPGSRNGKLTSWDEFLERLFVPSRALQILCPQCHRTKTNVRKAVHELR